MKIKYFLSLIIALILLIGILSLFRYSIHPVHNSLATAYKLDRLTGTVTVMYGNRELPLKAPPVKAPLDLSFLPDKPQNEK